jgi:hypothetical protein
MIKQILLKFNDDSHFGVTLYPPRVEGCPLVALKPADTRMMSGSKFFITGTTTPL